jgi:aminoglycoside phosphotransferase (APT) family kinase protein
MSLVEGESFEPILDEVDELPPPGEIEARARSAAHMLAALHAVRPEDIGLGDEPEVTLEAEVGRWRRLFTTVDDSLRTGADECGEALLATIPGHMASVLVHGDYRLGNMLAKDGEVRALIDWEIWSRSDPRIDLSWFLLTGDPPLHSAAIRDAPGMPCPAALLAEYEQARGVRVENLEWFEALTQFKMAAAGALIVKHNRKRPQPDPKREARAVEIPSMIRRAREFLPR